MDNHDKSYIWATRILTILALCVVLLGAYTRLADAGLGCPDWPGCYGQIGVPQTAAEVAQAQAAFPHADPVEAAKAWPEMIHRYFAGTLGLGVFLIIAWTWRRKDTRAKQVTLGLLGILIFQAILGMWTVTWKLHPLVVMGHLLGGMTITSLLWWLSLNASPTPATSNTTPFWHRFAWFALIITLLQIFLGGWTSANYASLICPDFPYCQGSLTPPMDFHSGFNLLSPIGANYQGGALSTTARIAIQVTHRLGAAIVTTALASFAFGLLFKLRQHETLAIAMLAILAIQIALGVANVAYILPLPIAVTHNGTALLLLLVMVTLLQRLQPHN